MAREQTLLERLREGEEPVPGHTAVENTTRLIRSVQANISRVLNAREGHALAQLDYGTPPPSEIVYGFPQSIARMQRRIKALLERYEPRLGDLDILHIQNEHKHMLVLRYQLQARLVTSSARSWVRYFIQMDPSGRITVSR